MAEARRGCLTAWRREEAFHQHAIATGNTCQQIDKKDLKAAQQQPWYCSRQQKAVSINSTLEICR